MQNYVDQYPISNYPYIASHTAISHWGSDLRGEVEFPCLKSKGSGKGLIHEKVRENLQEQKVFPFQDEHVKSLCWGGGLSHFGNLVPSFLDIMFYVILLQSWLPTSSFALPSLFISIDFLLEAIFAICLLSASASLPPSPTSFPSLFHLGIELS